MKIVRCGGFCIRGCAVFAKEKSKEKKDEEAQEEREAGKVGRLTTPSSPETPLPHPLRPRLPLYLSIGQGPLRETPFPMLSAEGQTTVS